jgi:hypothetical protein
MDLKVMQLARLEELSKVLKISRLFINISLFYLKRIC